MQKIEPQPSSTDAKHSLEWLMQGDNYALNESGLNDIIRLLISKINQLAQEVEHLKNRVKQLDSFHN